MSGGFTQQGRVQSKKLGLTSGPGSAAPWYPGVCGYATTRENRSQSHITCSLGPVCCSCRGPGRSSRERGNSQS